MPSIEPLVAEFIMSNRSFATSISHELGAPWLSTTTEELSCKYKQLHNN